MIHSIIKALVHIHTMEISDGTHASTESGGSRNLTQKMFNFFVWNGECSHSKSVSSSIKHLIRPRWWHRNSNNKCNRATKTPNQRWLRGDRLLSIIFQCSLQSNVGIYTQKRWRWMGPINWNRCSTTLGTM